MTDQSVNLIMNLQDRFSQGRCSSALRAFYKWGLPGSSTAQDRRSLCVDQAAMVIQKHETDPASKMYRLANSAGKEREIRQPKYPPSCASASWQSPRWVQLLLRWTRSPTPDFSHGRPYSLL